MYGTVMIGRLAVPFTEVEKVVAEWESERGGSVPGYVGQSVMLADDGVTTVAAIRFTDKTSYDALADDPIQDQWWTGRMAPCFDGDVQWIDGEWMR